MIPTTASRRSLLGAVGAWVLAFGLVGKAQSSDDLAWQRFDRIYASATPNFDTRPNALLMAAIEGRVAGWALDVGMGQGRNAVALAVARAQAARAGVSITATQESAGRFDLGTNQWDLVAVIYGPGAIAEAAYVTRLQRSLRPGGVVVVESFASDRGAAQRRPVDIDPADLRHAFAAFKILRFEDTRAVSDWDPQTTRLVRLVAQKMPE